MHVCKWGCDYLGILLATWRLLVIWFYEKCVTVRGEIPVTCLGPLTKNLGPVRDEQVPAFSAAAAGDWTAVNSTCVIKRRRKKKKEKTNEPAAGFKCSDKPRVLHLAPEYCPVLRWRLADHSSPHKRSFMTRQNDYNLRTLKHFFYKKKEGEL